MTRTQSDICDDIGISFVQGRHGWSDLIIGYKGEVLNCRISRVFTDDLADLVRLAEAVLDNQPETLNLMDEPGGKRRIEELNRDVLLIPEGFEGRWQA